MLKLFFKYQNSIDFFEYFDFDGIEPFTMIIVENNRLFEFRWNGLIKHIVELDVERMHVWNSCTLYDQEAQLERAALLKSYLDGVDLMNKEVIKNAHLVKDQENLINGLNMNRGSILTISHTQVVRLSNQINLHYHDLINRTLISQAI